MGSAELGDAGGPLLVAAVATWTTLTHGFAALAVILAIGPACLLARCLAKTPAAR